MRTTIDIDDDVFSELKRLAASTKRTLKAVVDDALRAELSRRRMHQDAAVGEPLITYGGRGTLPGVNIDSSRDLLDLMEGAQ